jgi:hypothetical protein
MRRSAGRTSQNCPSSIETGARTRRLGPAATAPFSNQSGSGSRQDARRSRSTLQPPSRGRAARTSRRTPFTSAGAPAPGPTKTSRPDRHTIPDSFPLAFPRDADFRSDAALRSRRCGLETVRGGFVPRGVESLPNVSAYASAPGSRNIYVCRSSSAAGVLVMSRAPRPWVTKLMNQRIKTIRRFWKPTR